MIVKYEISKAWPFGYWVRVWTLKKDTLRFAFTVNAADKRLKKQIQYFKCGCGVIRDGIKIID